MSLLSTVRRGAAWLFLLAVLEGSITSCASGENSVEASAPASVIPSQAVDAFVHAARRFESDYEPSDTVADLAARADVVIEGEIEAVAPGQSYATGAGSDPVIATSVLAVHVSQVLVGDASLVYDGRVYVEIPHPAFVGTTPADEEGSETMKLFDHAAFARTVPIGVRGIFFLDDRTEASYSPFITDEGAGRPEGAPITATYVQGFLIQPDGGQLISVSEPLDSMPRAWWDLSSLDDVREAIRQS